MASRSTNAANTSAQPAAKVRVNSTVCVGRSAIRLLSTLLFAGQVGVELVKLLIPKPPVHIEPTVRGRQRPGVETDVVRSPALGAPYQAGTLENTNVFRGGGQRHLERLGELAHRALLRTQAADHAPPRRVTQSLEHVVQGFGAIVN